MTRIEASVYWYIYRWNLMVLLSSLSSRDCARKFRQVLPQWSNQPITIFHPRDGKSPLARLPLAPWLLARHLVQVYLDIIIYHNNYLIYLLSLKLFKDKANYLLISVKM